MVKNNTNLIITFLMVSMLFFVFQPMVSANEYDITFHTGAVGGGYMQPAVVWSELYQDEIPDAKVSVVTGGGTTNPVVVSQSEDPNENIGVTSTIVGNDVIKGEGYFADKEKFPDGGIQNLRALFRWNMLSYATLVVRSDRIPEGTETMGDIIKNKIPLRWANKIVSAGDDFDHILSFYGLDYDDFESWGSSFSHDNPDDIGRLMIDGKADIHFGIVRAPAAYILDMDVSIKDLKWLKFEPELQDFLVEERGWVYADFPAGVYSSAPESFPTVAIDHFTFVNEEMDEELAYQLTKLTLLNPDLVKEAVPAMENFDPEVAWSGTIFPLHKGAEQAYRELGLIN